MSGENEGEENDNSEEEFKFYLSFTKPLVLDLPTEEDRALAAAWVQKLEAEPSTQGERQDRLNYLKLLLFVLQRGRLSGIFARQPPPGPLQPFPHGFTVLDIGNLMMEQDDDSLYGSGDAGSIPYSMELSNDMREYVASQEVPNFGVQMYYAWSSEEPVHKWLLFDEDKFPNYILEKIKQLKVTKRDKKESKDGKDMGNISLPDLCSANRVKSPDEIEQSQGRSFLTFMGLVGRNGNYNEKCDNDPMRSARQNSPKKCPVKKKMCPGGNDDNGEDDAENFASPSGGEINSINRPCLCPSQGHQQGCSSLQQKKRPQSCENRMMGNTPDCENGQWNSAPPPPPVSKSPGGCRMREQFYDNNGPPVTAQRNSPPRSSPGARRGMECPAEGTPGGFQNQGEVCICPSPPCTCPCPRSPLKSPVQRPPTPGGRACQSPSRTCTRAPRQEGAECNVNRNRGIGTHLTSFVAPDPCTPSPRSDMTPTGGRTNGGANSLRPVVHCYDNQNPDPALTRTIEKNDNWLPLEGGGAKYLDTDYKMAHVRDQLISKAMENKCTLNSRRALFNSPQAGPSGLNRSRPQTDYPQPTCGSPPLSSHPLCDYGSNDDEAYPQQQFPQNFQEYQGGGPDMYPSCRGRGNASTQKKPKAQSACQRNKNANQSASLFAVSNESGRLANMSNVLQGLKQKTEAYRDKCADNRTPRSGEAGAFCLGGNQGQNQLKSPPRQAEPRARSPVCSAGNGYQPPPPSPQPFNKVYPNRGAGNFGNAMPGRNLLAPGFGCEGHDFTEYKDIPQGGPPPDNTECEEEDEDEDEDESSGSMDEACANKMEDENYTQCTEALNRRPQDYYRLNWEDDEPQEPRQEINVSANNAPPYQGSSSPGEFIGTMLSVSDYGPQWTTARGIPKSPNYDLGTYTVMDEERCARASPGRSPQRAARMNNTQDEDLSGFDESFRYPAPQANRNRYFDRSLIAQAYPQQNYQPVCSTPLRHHRDGFKGGENVSSINQH